MSAAINLGELVNQTDAAWASVCVSGMTSDSRHVRSGDVFVALQGARVNGAEFIDDAVEAGAVAILSDSEASLSYAGETPVVRVKSLHKNLSEIAGRFYSDPSAAMDIIGITGTNGKTTTALLAAQLLQKLGRKAAVMGTLGFGLLEHELTATGFTTPDAITTQRALALLREQGADTLTMEVSSHALAQHRARHVAMRTGVFTNLSHDHLDFHGDLKAYGKAKARLLKARGLQHAVINRDDPWCKSLLKKAGDLSRVLSYSLTSAKADVRFESIEYLVDGIHARVNVHGEQAQIRSKLVGDFNASNLLAVIAIAYLRGFSLTDICAQIEVLTPAPGRMEQVRIAPEQDIQVVVDYAHTPDALVKALRALRRHTEGSIWCVFGCGGDRDPDKRPVMGRVAEKSADYVLVTNDNPRSEDPAEIASQIVRGMHNPERCLIIPERDKAIALAVQQAAAGDAVLLAGKGHEQVQSFAERDLPFSDVEQAIMALQIRQQKSGGGA
ncbi:UDP-N-acetylmuramoyl-L-alanyl-D-glutamate--2,6-diaminopimelate ligase [Gilvimarinus sp. DA14]|uniref:UDP-N-acetylmuramoyl-L-alanyl-D-glutamate--2, 6-diaminopimelate ligase n=1 Tax=Gilvimarinus sp. DA14 TaxID=2956798 RepID=UPI0020B89A86|nr:UDP-N-acetylmuramoyl-L-alanyl-D-glutamate--2,6-diaminopimelate ligase [Gilvimarinus sp. DA14]UTF59640.1 UDP-N-acetylmuramoyl-L-alanyl-D-glutamate--2,6-diaminopimelate ligase [Gilvimarinus sp. DA14]